ncbi:transposase-like protein [Sphingobium xenophagum]|uniref:Transposase-like protein n=1 Tax=Sphingobium xenophagum TaxID=121428 RepID=A0ABU1WYI2_SPHXE|nr:transposase-like protein [Sphingobium xenophagum]
MLIASQSPTCAKRKNSAAPLIPVDGFAEKIGWAPQTLHEWVKALDREVRELPQANEILRKASAYFAQAERAEIARVFVAPQDMV